MQAAGFGDKWRKQAMNQEREDKRAQVHADRRDTGQTIGRELARQDLSPALLACERKVHHVLADAVCATRH